MNGPSAAAQRPLIVGAGPVGLAAALFCARSGERVRIVDAAASPSPYSKALAVNPRTLEMLEPTGVTERMMALGRPLAGASVWREHKLEGEISIAGRTKKYPMLALSQAATERLLREELARHGIEVERSTELINCKETNGEAEVAFERLDGSRETLRAPWVLGADGAHSAVRKSLGIPFEGSSFPEPWYLWDVPFRTDLDANRAHAVFFEAGGFAFLMPVIDGEARPGDPIWRVISTHQDVFARLGRGEVTAPALWESQFHIAHRIADRLSQGPFYLAGDAAHIHSPVGARGMNLGIEDAWVFGRLAHENALGRYSALRRPIDAAVVKRVEIITYMARGASPLTRFARTQALPRLMRVEPLVRRALATITGLDHPLPAISSP